MADEPSQPSEERSLEARISELEDKLSQVHITEDEMKAFRKVSSLLGGQAAQSVPAVGAAGLTGGIDECGVNECRVVPCVIRQPVLRNPIVIRQPVIRHPIIQQCAECFECGGFGGGGFGGGGFGGGFGGLGG